MIGRIQMLITTVSAKRIFVCLVLVLIGSAACMAEPANLPWDVEALSNPPQTWPAEGFEEPGVRALFYEGAPFKGEPTRVFAWYGVPEGAEGKKLPAMVLVHGGGGTAFAEWVRLWTGRGYCAIAMDTCGCVPRGTYGNWERHEHGGPAGWGGFDQSDAPVTDQWTYHAIADVMLAHSLIRSFPEVDAERTGVTGISWGGYLTCITAGVDARFKLAVPVYGCGFLGENSTWLDTFTNMGEEKATKWLSLWDPSVYLPNAAMPMLWVTGTNDFAYPMDSLQKSYRLTQGDRTLCIRIRMPHGHGGAVKTRRRFTPSPTRFSPEKPPVPWARSLPVRAAVPAQKSPWQPLPHRDRTKKRPG
jgi:dienelactone hydrolase